MIKMCIVIQLSLYTQRITHRRARRPPIFKARYRRIAGKSSVSRKTRNTDLAKLRNLPGSFTILVSTAAEKKGCVYSQSRCRVHYDIYCSGRHARKRAQPFLCGIHNILVMTVRLSFQEAGAASRAAAAAAVVAVALVTACLMSSAAWMSKGLLSACSQAQSWARVRMGART